MIKKESFAKCKDCKTPIFVDYNMVMIKDTLWKIICDAQEDYICDVCMERRLGRQITVRDFRSKGIPCNEVWLYNKFHRFSY